MRIYAVIVTYNRKALLEECLERIVAQTYPLERVIIVDNASTDGTQEMLAGKGYLDSTLIDYRRMESNLGGAGGFREGMRIAREAKADWVWIMDDDTIPRLDSLEALATCAAKKPSAGFFASCVEGPSGEPMNVPEIDTRGTENGYKDWYMSLNDGMVKIGMATFVSLLINGKAMQKCGLPCKEFFLWGDDSEYTLRLTRNYGAAYLVGNSWVCHKRFNLKQLGIQFEDNPDRIKNYHYLYRNRLIRLAKYDSWFACLCRLVKYEALSFVVLFSHCGPQRFLAVQRGVFEFILEFRKFCRLIDEEQKGER